MSTIPFLSKTTLADIIPNTQKTIVTLTPHMTIPEAMQILSDHHISSAPVGSSGEYLGFIDFVDIMCFVVSVVNADFTEQSGQALFKLLSQEKVFHEKHIGALVDLSKRNPFWPVKKNTTLLAAMQLMAKTGAHRLPIIDDNKQITHVISLSDVVQFLNTHVKELGLVADKTVREFGIGSSPVHSVSVNDPAMSAFQLMSQHRISAVALLETDGTILSNISAKDIKIVMKGMMLPKLYETSRQFASEVRQANLFSFAPSVTIHEADSLTTVLGKLSATRLHRVYLKDPHERPTGVVALGDIIRAVLSVDSMDS